MIPFGERAVRTIVKMYFKRIDPPEKVLQECIVSDIVESHWIFLKALVLEFHKLKIANLLHGSSPRERYEYFFKILETESYIDYFLTEYPVFENFLLKTVKNSLDSLESTKEFISIQKHEIEKKFNLKINDVEFLKFVGDRHPGEKRNVLVKFGERKFVFKYRDSYARYLLNRIADLIGESIDAPPHFVEYYSINGLVIEEWIDDRTNGYYSGEAAYKFGVISAISVLTRAKDLHHENIINSKSCGPIVIDYECFFRQRFTMLTES